MKACIEAQAMAAQTSWQFIQEVGLNTDPNTGQKEAVNVSFQFMQNGHIVQLNVPLLTIVPIPYIAIHDIDINFKANISASSSSVSEQSSSHSLRFDTCFQRTSDNTTEGNRLQRIGCYLRRSCVNCHNFINFV